MSDAPRLDRTAVAVFRLGEEPDDRVYWQSRPPEERLAAVEDLRRRYYGLDYDAPGRLLPVCRIVPRA